MAETRVVPRGIICVADVFYNVFKVFRHSLVDGAALHDPLPFSTISLGRGALRLSCGLCHALPRLKIRPRMLRILIHRPVTVWLVYKGVHTLKPAHNRFATAIP